MSKKPQPQKQQNQKNRLEIVDQQNEPFLKALQKKIRNINKKLTQITQLQSKDNLKPEQIEKINRKDTLLEERAKIQENAAFFKQTYAENAVIYRNNQLKELEILARGIAIHHYGGLQGQYHLNGLWNALQFQENKYTSLNQAIDSISNALKEFANDRKLQKGLAVHVEKQGNEDLKQVVHEKPSEPACQQKIVAEAKKEQVVVVQKDVIKAEQTAIHAEKIEEQIEVIASTPSEQTVETVVKAQPAEQSKTQKPKTSHHDRPRYQKNPRPQAEGEKKVYRPKYHEKTEKEDKEREDSDSDSEEVRRFKKEEIRKLEDEGFIVVGKPKPKAKDASEQRNAHERQHGKKTRHHHNAVNH